MNDFINVRSESLSVHEMKEKDFASYLENIKSANDSLRAVLIDGFSLSEIKTKRLERILYVLIPKIKKSHNVIEFINLINYEISKRAERRDKLLIPLTFTTIGALFSLIVQYVVKKYI